MIFQQNLILAGGKILTKSRKRFSKKQVQKSRLFKLIKKLKRLPVYPNTRLHISLKDKPLERNLCETLSRELNLDYDFSKPKSDIAHKYNRYRWDLRINNKSKFKRALSKYQESNPNLNIYSDDLNSGVWKWVFGIISTGLISGVVFNFLIELLTYTDKIFSKF